MRLVVAIFVAWKSLFWGGDSYVSATEFRKFLLICSGRTTIVRSYGGVNEDVSIE